MDAVQWSARRADPARASDGDPSRGSRPWSAGGRRHDRHHAVSGARGELRDAFAIAVDHEVDERLRDHAWFITYAPADNPKIALAVLVENGGFGAQAAAPIARKVLDYHLLGRFDEPGPAGAAPPPAQGEDESD